VLYCRRDCLTCVHDGEENVIVEVLADSREINDDRYIDAGEKSRVTNTRDLQDLGGVNGSSRKDDFLLCLDSTLGAVPVLRELREGGKS
jgi:hypothetical protein